MRCTSAAAFPGKHAPPVTRRPTSSPVIGPGSPDTAYSLPSRARARAGRRPRAGSTRSTRARSGPPGQARHGGRGQLHLAVGQRQRPVEAEEAGHLDRRWSFEQLARRPVGDQPPFEQDQQPVGQRPRLGAVVDHDQRRRASMRAAPRPCRRAARREWPASSPANGSSSSSTSGRTDTARARCTRRRSPPESVAAGTPRQVIGLHRRQARLGALAALCSWHAPPAERELDVDAHRRRARSGACSASATRPLRCTLPAGGCERPASASISVLLPAPLGPSSATSSPARTSMLTSRSTSRSPRRTLRCSQASIEVHRADGGQWQGLRRHSDRTRRLRTAAACSLAGRVGARHPSLGSPAAPWHKSIGMARRERRKVMREKRLESS